MMLIGGETFWYWYIGLNSYLQCEVVCGETQTGSREEEGVRMLMMADLSSDSLKSGKLHHIFSFSPKESANTLFFDYLSVCSAETGD